MLVHRSRSGERRLGRRRYRRLHSTRFWRLARTFLDDPVALPVDLGTYAGLESSHG